MSNDEVKATDSLRKVRLKNNWNVNVFCNAAFWEQGLVRLLYEKGDDKKLL